MRSIFRLARYAALAGSCAGSLLAPSAEAGTHTVLYSFGTGGDGTGPAANMINMNGSLYGTTVSGGAHSSGTVFKVASTTGTERLVYSFKTNVGDGVTPKSPVVNVGGTYYGTTEYGGSTACSGGCGTVFGVTKTGAESLLYQFQGSSDGANPTAGLVNVKGTLYGTTYSGGGASNYGTVFSITPAGVEKVLYAFKGGTDGANPMGGLVNFKGKLYGTTYTGGASYAYGTVFSLTTTGVKNTVYSFKNGSDGAYPESALVGVGKKLYGISLYGSNHLGTVYSVNASGVFKALYSFTGGLDGSGPVGSLINVNGTLYGVTYSGGSTTVCNGYGCGTVFSVTPAGTETVVYAFQGGNDGLNPQAGLTDVNGAIYGTTASGGTNYNGTVFSVSP